MIKKRKQYSNLFNLRLLRGLLSLGVKEYFEDTGWNRSYIRKESVDNEDRPIPWLTYSFLDFLEGRLDKEMSLFEYGSGNSTLFFSRILKRVDSVEHDTDWFHKIQSVVPENVTLQHRSLGSVDYENAILDQNHVYDMIIIDGRKRNACVKSSIERIKPEGVIILDDSERVEHAESFTFMEENGYKNLPFSGIAIGAIHHKITTVFYKENNCLGI